MNSRELGNEEDIDRACCGGAIRRCVSRNIESRGSPLGLLRWLGLPWRLGLPRWLGLPGWLGLSRSGLGSRRICGRRRHRRCAGNSLLLLSDPRLSGLLLLLVSGSGLLLLSLAAFQPLKPRRDDVCSNRHPVLITR